MKKRAKASDVYDGRECAEIRHTTARSVDTEKVADFFFFKCAIPNRYNLRNRCLRDVHIHINIHLYCSKHDYADSPPKTNAPENQRVPSPFSIRSRHNLHTAAAAAAAAAAVPGLESTKGSAPGAKGQDLQSPSNQWLGGFVHRAHGLPPCLPSLIK